jgi:DNA-binding CsgD family transcriptional regulator
MSSNLSRVDMRAALDTLHTIGQDCVDSGDFARRGVQCLPRLVSSELTTLSVCNLDSGHRRVVCDQPGAILRRELEVFDRYFFDHPLVREHGRNPAAVTRRIEDLLPDSAFQRTPLFNDYYCAIRIDHVMAVPIYVDRHVLVSFVVNRSKRGFSDRDRERVEVIRPHLGHLYRLSTRAPRNNESLAEVETPLTVRERDVLNWLGAGKTDKDIAAILAISPRTVQKHLQRIYEKLGVETRTAAVMRAIATRH